MPRISTSARTARRDQILAAALTCFARAGYHATTMADVAAQAGVSKGTPYLYFPSKEALFIALHDDWGCELFARVNAAVAALSDADRGSPRRVLRAVAEATGIHVREQAETCRVLLEAQSLAAYHPAIARAVQAADMRIHEQLERLFRDGITAGAWPAEPDPALRARLFISSIYGLMAHWHLAPGSFSWDAAADTLSRL
jgi:TetR/AcrR family transcriptional repressor of uid operon